MVPGRLDRPPWHWAEAAALQPPSIEYRGQTRSASRAHAAHRCNVCGEHAAKNPCQPIHPGWLERACDARSYFFLAGGAALEDSLSFSFVGALAGSLAGSLLPTNSPPTCAGLPPNLYSGRYR